MDYRHADNPVPFTDKQPFMPMVVEGSQVYWDRVQRGELKALYKLAVENARLRAQLKELRKVLNTENV